MIKAEQIPQEVVEAAARALAVGNETREDWWRFYEGKALAALAAGLAKWPRAYEFRSTRTHDQALALPLPQEGGE